MSTPRTLETNSSARPKLLAVRTTVFRSDDILKHDIALQILGRFRVVVEVGFEVVKAVGELFYYSF